MAQIIWTNAAIEDLERIIQYISGDAPLAARRFAKRIMDRVEKLRVMPLMGAFIAEDRRKIYREVLVGNYRAIYRVEENTIFVVRVYHAARLLWPDDLS